MAQPATTFVDESRERIQTARERLDSEFKKAQKDVKARRKNLEKQFAKNRKSFDKGFAKNRKSFEKQATQLRKDIERNSIVKQMNRWRNDAEEQFEDVFGNVLSALQIATQSDVKKLDRRVAKLTKQLKDLEGSKASHASA
jgi:polyhydroxyalkanoate synthesis regulator phasin